MIDKQNTNRWSMSDMERFSFSSLKLAVRLIASFPIFVAWVATSSPDLLLPTSLLFVVGLSFLLATPVLGAAEWAQRRTGSRLCAAAAGTVTFAALFIIAKIWTNSLTNEIQVAQELLAQLAAFFPMW